MTEICVVGSWHLSSVMGTCLAEVGHVVRGVHDDAEAIASLQKGKPTIYEPDLEASIKKNIKAGRLSYTTDWDAALAGIDIVFLSIDTPILDNGIDLSPIRKATVQIAKAARKRYTLVVSSQVPIGTCEELQELARANGKPCEVVCNPEFLRLGGAMDLQRNPDRVILGADREATAKKIAALYEPFGKPIMLMGLRDAELVKHATNAYVANSVSFIGEISQICDEYGADAYKIGRALKADRRIGRYAYVMPGLGFNGGTVSRDVKLLIKLARQKKCKAPMLKAVLDVNTRQNSQILERLRGVLGTVKRKKVALLGLTYKADTNTLRHSLTLKIAKQMLAEGLVLTAYDPVIPPHESAKWLAPDESDVPPDIKVCGSVAEAVDGAHAFVIMTGKDEFKKLRLGALGKRMKKRVMVDAVNFYEPAQAHRAEFTYIALGRGYKWL